MTKVKRNHYIINMVSIHEYQILTVWLRKYRRHPCSITHHRLRKSEVNKKMNKQLKVIQYHDFPKQRKEKDCVDLYKSNS